MNKFEGGQFFDPFGEPDKEQRPKVKDSWVKGVIDGYALWPERLNPGVSILATEAVLNDPPENWNDFLTSVLSNNQVKILESELSKYHKKGDLPYDSDRGVASMISMAERVANREESPADNYQSIQLLWMDTTDIVSGTILDVIHGHRVDEIAEMQVRDEERDSIFPVHTISRETLFADPRIVAKIPTAKPTLAAAKRGLVSTEGLELAELSKLGGSAGIKDGDERHKALIEKYVRRYDELNPPEEREARQRLYNEAGLNLTFMTTEEMFAGKTRWRLRSICAGLANNLIEKSIKDEGLPKKFSSWISH